MHTTGLTKRLNTSSPHSRRNPSTQYTPGAWFWRDALLATMPSSSMHAPMLVKNAFKRSHHSADWKVNMPVPILLGEQETDEWTALVVVSKTTGKCHEAYISTSVALTAITLSNTSSVPSNGVATTACGKGDWRAPAACRACGLAPTHSCQSVRLIRCVRSWTHAAAMSLLAIEQWDCKGLWSFGLSQSL